MLLNKASTVLSIFLPELVVLVFVKIPRLFENISDLLDAFSSQFPICHAQHPSEFPHLLKVDILLFLALLPRLMTSNTFLNINCTALLLVHPLLKRQACKIYLHRIQLLHRLFFNITVNLPSFSDNCGLLIYRFLIIFSIWYNFSIIALHSVVELCWH
jgi:hypothetical protein